MKDIDEQYLLTLTLRDAGGQRQVYYKDNRVNETAYVEEFLESGGMTLPSDQKTMSASTFGKMAADVPAGLAKGAIQGTVGIGGDIESLVYGVREIIKRGAGESALDAFIRGLESDTILPKTEEIKPFILRFVKKSDLKWSNFDEFFWIKYNSQTIIRFNDPLKSIRRDIIINNILKK